MKGLSSREKEEAKYALSFVNPAWKEAKKFRRSTYGIPKMIRQYTDHKNSLEAPRGFLYNLISMFGEPEKITDNTSNPEPLWIPSKIELRPYQIPWVESMLLHRQGIGIAPPGSGKTVMALEIISRIGLPTLWLTHRQNLMGQFISRAEKFLEAGKPGLIGMGENIIGDALTVGMIPTLVREGTDLGKIGGLYGVVIVDECHHVPSTTFSKVVSNLSPKFLYGLSATPYRRDRLESLMYWTVGPEIAQMSREEARIITPKVIVRKTGFSLRGEFSYDKLIEAISISKSRNNLIVSDVIKELSEGHLCVILTTTIDHGRTLKNFLGEKGINTNHPHSKLSPKNKQKEIDEFTSGKTRVLVATYSLLAEGFDYAPTDRLFFANPMRSRTYIEQAKGRIERISEGKTDALVFEYLDNIPIFIDQFEEREEIYKENNMKIVYT